MDGWMDGQTDGRMDGWTDGRMDGWMDGWTDGWMDSRMVGQLIFVARGSDPMSLHYQGSHLTCLQVRLWSSGFL